MQISARLAALLFVALPGFGAQLFLTIQPVQVCNTAGTSCANAQRQLFSDIGNAIWAQANITLEFLPWQSINNTNAYSGTALTSAFLNSNATLVPNPTIGYLYFLPQATVANAVNNASILGVGYLNYGLSLIADNTFGDPYYADVIAHELGHNLGLDHIDGSQYLMNATNGNVNEVLADIYPTGTHDLVTSDEISTARTSYLLRNTSRVVAVAPEPGTAVLSLGVLGIFALRRRRARA